MKRTVIATTVACLLTTVASAQVLPADTTVFRQSFDHQNNPNTGLCEAMVLLGLTAVGFWIYFKVKCTCPIQTSPETFILQETLDGKATWHNIATNTVVLNQRQWIDVFVIPATNDYALYRAIWAKNYVAPAPHL